MIRIADCLECASDLGLEPEIIQAVAIVESGKDINAFLFEPHVFSNLTNHKFDASYPDISYQEWDRSRYPKNPITKQIQFDKAVELGGDKAYQATSWGLFQIMGYHYRLLGYDSAKSMSIDLQSTIQPNVSAFGKFLRNKGLIDNLRNKEWDKFARLYNGPAYKLNKYDTNIAKEYAKLKSGNSKA